MTEKERLDRLVLNALHPGTIAGSDESPGAPDFGGGVRESALPVAPSDPRPPAPVYREAGWAVVEVEDGAELLFPWMR